MRIKIFTTVFLVSIMTFNSSAQEYETCGYSGEEAWAGDTAAITAFLISCGRIDTTNYDENGKKTTGKPHHQKIVMKLNSSIGGVVTDSEMKGVLAKLGIDAFSSTPEQFAKVLDTDLKRWAPVVKAAGMKPE